MRPWLLALAVLFVPSLLACADDWPQWLGPRRDGIWRESGILDKFPKGGPRICWRSEIGSGFSGPAVVQDRVYVTDRKGEMPSKGSESSGKKGLKGSERVVCLSAKDGKQLWEHSYDSLYRINYPSGPRTTPLVAGDKVWTLGAMGDLLCLDAGSGKSLWSKNLPEAYKTKPPVWGYAAHPLLVDDMLICQVGGTGSAVVAFHRDTGKELWKALTTDEIAYAPPTLIEAAGKRQVIVFVSDGIHSLDPATGTVYWSEKYPEDGNPTRPSVAIGMPRVEGNKLLVSSFYHGSLLLELAADRPAAKVVWRGKSEAPGRDGLHSIMTTPVLKDGHVYGVCAFGELRCLKLATAERLWETFAATTGKKTFFATAFLIEQGDRFFIFTEQGDLLIAKLTPKGYEELDRAHLLTPTLFSRGRDVVWSHPAFAEKRMYVRNDKELICVDLAAM